MFFVNGNEQLNVPVSDRSFQYGDGCFTTVLVKQGKPLHFADHKSRIEHTCERLFISALDWNQIESWVETAIVRSGHQSLELSGLKIHISRGCGGRGYSPRGIDVPQVVIQTFEYPEHYSNWQLDGIKLGIASTRLGINPALAGLKHNNRLEQVLIKKEIDSTDYDDNIILNIHGNIIETSAANIFWKVDSDIYTPDLSYCGVTGIKRRQVLEHLDNNQMKVNIGRFTIDDMQFADEIFITNAIHGVVPIVQIESKTYKVGAITRTLQEKVNP